MVFLNCNANLLTYMFFSSVYRRLSEHRTSYPKCKVPDEIKIVTRSLIGSYGYKSEEKLRGELVKNYCLTLISWSWQSF